MKDERTIEKRKNLVLFVILVLITPTVLLLAKASHPQFKIGIVLVDGCDEYYANLSITGYREYDDFFEAQLLPVRFNASEVRVKDNNYLNSDFFRKGQPETLAQAYHVDIIIFVTDHYIKNWDSNGLGVSGEADPETSSALVSVASYTNHTATNNRVIQHIAIHEVMHLLGYTHSRWSDDGLMLYARNTETIRLNGFNEFQLPLRAWTFMLTAGISFSQLVILSYAIFVLALLPSYYAFELTIFKAYRRLQAGRPPPRYIVWFGTIESFLVLMIFRESFYFLFVPMVFMLFFHQYDHMYETLKRRKCKDKGTDG